MNKRMLAIIANLAVMVLSLPFAIIAGKGGYVAGSILFILAFVFAIYVLFFYLKSEVK